MPELPESPPALPSPPSLHDLTGRQSPPLAPGLYLVATPIGNLEDITLRGLRVLREADRIACEDTRQTSKLLHSFGVSTPTVSYHAHNEANRSSSLLAELQGGARIALVSDAGTPAIADPGALLVRECIAAGVPVFPVPGPTAALSALTASGLPTERFRFNGFLPSRPGERRSALEELVATAVPGQPATTEIWYDSPHRILESLADLQTVFGPGQILVLARELTKLHEEFLRGTVSDVLAQLFARDSIRGEFVLVFSPAPPTGDPSVPQTIAESVRHHLNAGLAEKDALKHVARDRGLSKSDVYREWQRTR